MKFVKSFLIGCLLFQGVAQASDEQAKPLTLTEKAILHRSNILLFGIPLLCVTTPFVLYTVCGQSDKTLALSLPVAMLGAAASITAGLLAKMVDRDNNLKYYKLLPDGTKIECYNNPYSKEGIIQNGRIKLSCSSDPSKSYFEEICTPNIPKELDKPNVARDRFVVESALKQYSLAGQKFVQHGNKALQLGKDAFQSWNKFSGGTLTSDE